MKRQQTNSGWIVLFDIIAFSVAALTICASPPTVHAQNADNEGEKRFTMDFTNARWGEVFDWHTDKSGKPFVSRVAPPPGAFSHATPKETTYSLLDITGIINDALLKQDYVLVPRKETITLLRVMK